MTDNQEFREISKPLIKQGWLRALLIIIPWMLFVGIFQSLGILIASKVTGLELSEVASQMLTAEMMHWMLLSQLLATIGTATIIYIFQRFFNKRPFKEIGLQWGGYQIDAFWGFMAGFVLISIGFWGLYLLKYLSITGFNFNPLLLLIVFVLCILISLNEELIVRGYILNNLMDSMNKYIALLISALFFALLHGINPNITALAFFNIFIAGIFLGITYIHTKNLWFPIFLHFSWNFFQGPFYGFEVSGHVIPSWIQQKLTSDSILTGGDFGFEGSPIVTVTIILLIIAIEFYYRGKSKNATFEQA